MCDEILQFTPRLSADVPNAFYVGHRPPLTRSPFQKLPIGSIRPKGWLLRQLELQAEGFSGRLSEISEFLKPEGNAWMDPKREGRNGWEEVPYWLKGQADLGYILDDARIQRETKPWIEAALRSQREDGWFGPESNLKAKDGKPDLWPNMIMLFVLQSHYEYANDPRVLELMTNYFRWQLALPDDEFLHPPTYWHYHRGGDNLLSVLWLYNRTGDSFLLELARKLHRLTADWVSGVPDVHGVNIAQAIREPATYSLVSGDRTDLEASERDYLKVREDFGQVPGGMYGADENLRSGFTDPRQATEACAMVEAMFSFEYLMAATGDPAWADRAEDVALNSYPASMTPDLRALRYLTGANHVLSDRGNKHPGIANTGPMYAMDPNDHRCCQHNVAQGWPYYAEHLWMATSGNGLAAMLYSACEVTAQVGDGTPVKVGVETDYPFRESVRLRVQSAKPNRFPLALRVPGWCAGPPSLRINGQRHESSASGAGFIVIERAWENDEVEIEFPAEVKTVRWPAHDGAVSVIRGPLAYSLEIGEKVVRSGGTDAWPAFEIHPTTPWNYGLEPKAAFETELKDVRPGAQPFSADAVPIKLKTRGRRIPGWRTDHLGLAGKLQSSPARVDTPSEAISLIPMGAARLRVTVFPTVTTDDAGIEWIETPETAVAFPASASHVNPGDSLDALSDTLVPESSSDISIPRFSWWDRKGTEEWVQYDFGEDKFIGKVEVYWYDDGPRGLCRPPENWSILYWENGDWVEAKPREGGFGTEVDRFNEVFLMPFRSAKMRLVAKLREGHSAGILEWRFR